MRKLELKEIVAYLPYGLKCKFPMSDNFLLLSAVGADSDGCNKAFFHLTKETVWYKFDAFKPLLIPMSEQNTLLKWPDGEYMMTDIKNEHLSADDMDYPAFVMYIEHHFDVFNLIESGLALNKLEYI